MDTSAINIHPVCAYHMVVKWLSHITEDLPALLVKDIKGGEVTDLGYPGIARRCKQIKVKSGKGSKDYRF
mgnify:CR=1 FL=1